MPTEPLTGTPYPATSAAPNVPQDIQNAVTGLADNTIPRYATTTARDTAYSAYVSSGGTLSNGMICWCDSPGSFFSRVAGAWVPTGPGGYASYYGEGNGGGTIGTSATAPTDSASVAVPAGTYDVQFSMHFSISVATDRTFVLYLRTGSTDLSTPSFPAAVIGTGSAASFTFNGFRRVTLGASSTLVLRASADATGGTQSMGFNMIRAVRV